MGIGPGAHTTGFVVCFAVVAAKELFAAKLKPSLKGRTDFGKKEGILAFADTEDLRDEGAADAQAALRGALRPNWLEIDAHRRKNRHMQNRQHTFRKNFAGFHL